MRKFLKLAGMLTVAALLPIAAQAGVITQTYTIESMLTDNNAPATSFSFLNYQSVAGYISGSVLTQVKITASGSATQTMTIANGTVVSRDFAFLSGNAQIKIYNNATGTPPSLISATYNGIYYDVGVSEVNQSIAAGGQIVYNGASSISATTNPIITAYDTTGSFQMSYKTSSAVTYTGDANLSEAQVTHVSGLVTVEYDYYIPEVTVPEPVSIALLGVGLLGIGAVKRVRRG